MSDSMKERFEQMPWTQQLGNLASTLGRISSRIETPQHDEMNIKLMEEAAEFIEWSAPHVPQELLLELAAMQREILEWKYIWPLDAVRPIVRLHTRNRSDRLIQMAGLLG
jgi:hypothetical protein